MEKLPVEIFDLILAHLTLTDWKCLRLTSRTIYARLSSFSSYSHLHSMILSPKSSAGLTLFDKFTSMEGIDHLSLSSFNYTELNTFLQTSESLRLCFNQLTSLSFARSTSLIDSRMFYELLSHCKSLEKLDLSNYKFFFLSHNFSQNSNIYPSIKKLNLSGNTHLSDYAFNRLVKSFPNIEALHLLDIPLRSSISTNENRTFLTFENVCSYFQQNQERFKALAISFDPSLSCDTQIKRLFIQSPPKLTYFHIDGTLNVSTLFHFLLVFDNKLETLIVGRLKLDPTVMCLFKYAIKFVCAQQQKICFPVCNQSSDISLSTLKQLNDLDIQTLYPLTDADIIHLLRNDFKNLKKLALPRNTTDDVIKQLCTQSPFVLSLTHLNLSNCSSLSNRSILLINKYLLSLEELTINYNININDFAFIGLSICGIGKSIEWLSETLIDRQFIDDLPIWTYTITHQTLCKCQLPTYLSSSCIKLRLKDFSFDDDAHSERILRMLTEHKLFNEYFYSINKLNRLKTLKLRQCIRLTNRLFRFGLRSLPSLKYLDLSLCEKMNDNNLSLIGQACPSIEIIDLSGCHRITENGKQMIKNVAKRKKSASKHLFLKAFNMVKVMISNVNVHNNPAKFLSNYTFEIKFECLEQLTQELEFKLVYVGDAKEDKQDQVLDVVVIDAVAPGTYKFVFEAPPPDPKKLPNDSDVDVSVILLLALYRNQEFARVGYYVFTEYDDPELRENPPVKVDFEKLNRNIAVDEPRVTTFPIIWDEQQSTDQLVFAELTEEEKKMVEMNDEIEICQSLENVNCANETPAEPIESKISNETMESIEPELANDVMESTEPKLTNEEVEATEPKLSNEEMEAAEPKLVNDGIESTEPKVANETMESTEPKLANETMEPTEPKLANETMESTEPRLVNETMDSTELKLANEIMEATETTLASETMEATELKLTNEEMEATEPKLVDEVMESNESKIANEEMESTELKPTDETMEATAETIEPQTTSEPIVPTEPTSSMD
ncbi:unnamed protein product [Rotaria socialis]|uniref:F-box domain-containing protein n=1 Tax=Rotaria socialis TaxID=392032 RepID=A0A818NTW6_9BILA|nr:unnamed protein product [Rotaria socialis]